MNDKTKIDNEKVADFLNEKIKLNNISSSPYPLVIFVTGVSGGGKSTLIESIDFNAIKIQSDNYRKLHPKINFYLQKYGRDEAYKRTGNYSFSFAKKLRDMAIEKRLNVIYEATFSKIDTAREIINPFIKNGYKIVVVKLPIDIELSVKRNIARYEEKKAQEHTIPRITTREDISKMANSYTNTLDEISKQGIKIIDRESLKNLLLEHQKKSYSNLFELNMSKTKKENKEKSKEISIKNKMKL